MQRKSAYLLFVAVLGLLVIGIVMLFSTSAFARDSHGDALFFLKRQAGWLGVGLFICIATALIDYHFWQRTWWIWLGIAAITLALCFIPHIGMRINGSRRWIGLGPVSFQPSEIGKIGAVFFLAWWFSRYEQLTRNPLFGFAIPLAIVSAILALILFEVDLGTTALIGMTTFVVMFVAGTNPVLLGLQ
jgi:cell division protein FtsW